MYFAYFDESGDDGMENSPTPAFVLSCVLVHERQWIEALDQLVAFRTYLKDQFGITRKTELKANWLLQRKGAFKDSPLSPAARIRVMESVMRFQRKSELFRVFAVVINKEKVQKRPADPRDLAWTRAMERLQTFASKLDERVHILPDEGHGYFIRRRLRQMRRHHFVGSAYGSGTLPAAATRILEDSSDRRSDESYFIQLADLNAYAAFKYEYPDERIGKRLWSLLGDARISDVNRLTGGSPGIVSWPR
jgi:Protein of unknown function (DUF3800)